MKRPAESILIADNSELYRRMLADFYHEMGYGVRVASDGLEALALIESAPPDLIVLDLIMPNIDGGQLCRLIKSRESLRRIPVIILSGILADEIRGIESIPADAYIGKMPMSEMSAPLRMVTGKLLGASAAPTPLVHGFEKMYRREVVHELLVERRTTRQILDSLSEGIAELSADHRLLSVNGGLERILGRPAEELLSCRLEEIFAASASRLPLLFEELSNPPGVSTLVVPFGSQHLQLKLHRVEPDHSELPEPAAGPLHEAIRSSIKAPVLPFHSVVGYALLVEDVSEKVKALKDRELLAERLTQSEKLSALGLFASGAAHELNNPLTGVLGYAQLLFRRSLDDHDRRDLSRIVEGANRCRAVVRNLLSFARRAHPARVPVDVNGLVHEAFATLWERISDGGVEVTLDLAAGLPESLADPDQLNQALLQLLDNALKALQATSGPRRLEVATTVEGDRIRLEVRDSGPGIAPDRLGRIFDPFFTTRPVGEGAGLGLSVTYGIVRAHGGRISARNRPEGGATFTIDLPLDPSAPAEQTGGLDSGRRILIVDDEAVVVELLADILENFQPRIDTASNGLEALLKVDANGYDLIILDLRMPDMTGQQLYAEIGARRPEALERVLFITADTISPQVQDFLRRTGRPHLTKPFSIQSVIEQAGSILSC